MSSTKLKTPKFPKIVSKSPTPKKTPIPPKVILPKVPNVQKSEVKPKEAEEPKGEIQNPEEKEAEPKKKKKIVKIRKPPKKKKPEATKPPQPNPAMEKERLRLQRMELNAMEKRWMSKKESEFNRKITDLTKDNETLKEAEARLAKENELVKNDRTFKEMELEKVSQFWTLTRQDLSEQRQRGVELETRMQRLKAAHVEQVSLLHKRITMLQLDTRIEQIGSTQTDPFGEDSESSGQCSVCIQTDSDWDRQKVSDVLKQHDDELGAFIAEIEHAKLQAQSDYKFAVVQMEQGLREEHEEELRAVKEEKDRQLEEMVRVQSEQLQQIENEKVRTKAELSAEISTQRVNIQELNVTVETKSEEIAELSDHLKAAQKQYDNLAELYRTLTAKFEKNKANNQILKNDAKTMGDLRVRLEKVEEINEIILGEFKKIETERNMFAEQLKFVIKSGGGPNMINVGSYSGEEMMSLKARNRAYELGEQLDEIRRKFGGLNL